jgi:N-6 DNA Methylase
MRTTLQVLSMEQIVTDVGIGFDVILDTVNSFAPEILARKTGKPDPILSFYEDFLHVFDPAARERYGVYYTPVEVVTYMVAALDRVLRDNLGTAGLADEAVTLLDPATGTGTFLLGVIEHARASVESNAGPGAVNGALRALAGRLFGFELLVGPVSGYRLLYRWLDARQGLAVDHTLVTSLRDVVGRIAELIDLFARADTVLERALLASLSRDALGLHQPEPVIADD